MAIFPATMHQLTRTASAML